MFCPLCKAEYLSGVTRCNDCHVELVRSEDEARFGSVRVWKGTHQRVLDQVLAALDACAIPSHFEEIVNTKPQINILGIPITRVRSTFEYEVWVLRSDSDKAQAAITDFT